MQSSVATNLHFFSILFYNKSQKWKILATLGLFWCMQSGYIAGCIQKSVDSSLCLIGLIVFLQSLMVLYGNGKFKKKFINLTIHGEFRCQKGTKQKWAFYPIWLSLLPPRNVKALKKCKLFLTRKIIPVMKITKYDVKTFYSKCFNFHEF